MPLNFLWILIISFALLFIVYLFTTASRSAMYRDNSEVHTLRTYRLKSSSDQFYVTSDNVKFLKSRQILSETNSNDSPLNARSPTSSYKGMSLADFPIGDFETIKTQNKKESYIFRVGSRTFSSIGEQLCCKIIEEYLGYEVLVNKRPDFLKNPETGRNLELDIWVKDLNFAVEYNGSQHYYENIYFNVGTEKLLKMKERDKLKNDLCAKNGIYLITVPYTVDAAYRNSDGEWREVSKGKAVRERKLKAFIIPLVEDYLKSLK